MEDNDSPFSPQEQNTVFNMAIATLQRIDDLLKTLSTFHMTNNIIGSRSTILELYKEVYIFMNDEHREDAAKMWRYIYHAEIKVKDANTISYNPVILDRIHEFDFWLRDVMQSKGLLMAKGDDPTKAMITTKGY